MAKPSAPWRIKGKKVYRSYSQEELDAQYDVSVPDSPERVRERRQTAEANALARSSFECRQDVKYGAGPDEVLDIFPAKKAGAPIVLNIHGGYWRQFSKSDESQYASVYIPAGAAYVAIDYTLAPAATIEAIVAQCRTAAVWVATHAGEFNGDSARIHLLGRSAGGHLCAMVMATDWAGDFGLEASPIAGATLVSGLYDLEPVMLSYANEWCRLDAASVCRLSPIYHLPERPFPVIVAWGGAETDEFRRQSQDYAVACQARGFPCTTIEIPGALHSGSRAELANRDSPLSRTFLTQLGL